MKFLLVAINAKYIHSNPAIYSLRAYAGDELAPYIELAEYTINQQMQDILADIYRREPDVVGFSCYIWNWNMVQELLRECPKLLPRTELWLGGPEVTYNGSDILKQFPHVKGIMVGEGEATFKELLQWYVGQTKGIARNLSDISGLCLPSGYTLAREPIPLTELPFLYDHTEDFANRIIYYETSRGCPYRCSYCLSAAQRQVRLRDMETVKGELQFFLDNRVKQVKFVDRTFNCDHEHTKAIWRYIHEHDNGVTNFHFEISADILQEEELALLGQMCSGLTQLEIGVQSVNPKTLEAVNRHSDMERLEAAVAAIHRGHNVHLHLDLIAGLPYEDYESFGNSFNRVYAMKPEQLQLGFLKVLKGSPLAERADEFGICYLSKPPYEVLYTKWLSYKDVLRLKGIEEMVEQYYNSGQFVHTLSFLEQAFESPFAMYETLADFYREQGFFNQSPARVYRYHVLLSFARRYDGTYETFYRELLTYDMLLREKPKSRPEFAMDIDASVRQRIREFYQTEEQNRVYLPSYEAYDWKQMSKMTHLEPFFYPVWDREEMRAYRHSAPEESQAKAMADKLPNYVLFDYNARDPLTYAAFTTLIRP
ncbi:MAG: B12-binding domain-containing radical SAM protein [Butyrivibrio sp.]|nr:B12-binding domain-containing radical SAM protein [Muribaculum sp.]MCM1553828.1 B12-binding domain-containing radical SAM protein [Butyrivibrio sp.]